MRRKAAGTIKVRARGRAAHSGSAPDRGRNALLALATAAQAVAARHAPDGPDRLTAVPTVLHAGDAFNVVPGRGELICDLRADADRAILEVLDAIPADVGGVTLEPELARLWPGMDAVAATAETLGRAGDALGRPVIGVRRGGASDASHLAAGIPLTIDGLGPRGGKAHNPGEFVLAASLRSRAEVALAVVDAALGLGLARGLRAERDRLELARAQQHEQLAAPVALEPDGGDAALLEVDGRTREVVDDLREGRVVADDEDAVALAVLREQVARDALVEVLAQRLAFLGRHVERLAGQRGGAGGADERARVTGRELEPEPRQRLARRDRLALAARGQLAVVIGLGFMRDGLSVAEEPELLLRHRVRRVVPASTC